MGSETAYWVRRNAFFSLSYRYCSRCCYRFARGLWWFSFRYCSHLSFCCKFLNQHSLSCIFYILLYVIVLFFGGRWCMMLLVWGYMPVAKLRFDCCFCLAFDLCFRLLIFCHEMQFSYMVSWSLIHFYRFSIRSCTNFLQNILWLKADHCVNFSAIPLPRYFC